MSHNKQSTINLKKRVAVLESKNKALKSSLVSRKISDTNYTMPAGISGYRGPSIKVLPHSKQNSLLLHARIPFGSAIVPPGPATLTGHNAGLLMNGVSAVGQPPVPQFVSTVALSPILSVGTRLVSGTNRLDMALQADSPYLALLGAAFSKNKLIGKLKIHYLPETSTSSDVAFGICFTKDCYNPIVGLAAYVNASGTSAIGPTYDTIKSSVNSNIFSAWLPMTMEVDVSNNMEYYNSVAIAGHLGLQAYNVYPFSDEDRLNFFGAITVLCNQRDVSAENPTILGQFYLEYTVEFSDFVPIASSFSVPYTLMRGLTSEYEFVIRKREENKLSLIEVKEPPDPEYQVLESPDGTMVSDTLTKVQINPVSAALVSSRPLSLNGVGAVPLSRSSAPISILKRS